MKVHGWIKPAIALFVGVTVLSFTVLDYAASPSTSKGIRVGPLFFQIPRSPVAAGHKPVGAPPPGTTGSNSLPGTGWTLGGDKAPSYGLLMRGPNAPPPALQSVVHEYIIEAHWDLFQPTQGGPIVTSAIDRSVAAVRAFNASHPTNPQSLRLRIEAGIHSPSWVKAMDGGAVSVSCPNGCGGASPGTIPRYWYPDVQAAYTAFIAKLAAYVDPIPEVREVTVGLTMLFFGEVFIRFPTQNAAAMARAGYTQALDLAAMKAMLNAHRAFTRTLTMLDVNAYQAPTGGNLAITKQMMDYAVAVLHGVEFTNASLTTSGNGSLYALMSSYGPRGSGRAAISFQTMPTIGSIAMVLGRAVSFGASSVELPSGVTAGQVAAFDLLLKANAKAAPWPWH